MQASTVRCETVLLHPRAALASMKTPGAPERVRCSVQSGLGAALASAGLSTAIPPGCVLALTAGRAVPGCAVEASAAAGAVESIAAAMTAIMSFRAMDIPVLSLIRIRKPRRGGGVTIRVRFITFPFCADLCMIFVPFRGCFPPRRDK